VREVHKYVIGRLPGAEAASSMVLAGETPAERDKPWGIIEID
jgi:hypothetical protein